MKSVLITGGCGFLGSNIAARLIEGKSARVTLLDNMSRVGSRKNLEWLSSLGAIDFVQEDVRSEHGVLRAVAACKPDVVFHLAGQVAMTTSLANPRLDFEVNALGSLNVLEAVRQEVPVAAVIYSSTNKVYGDLQHLAYDELETRYALRDYPLGLPESMGLEFHSPYGCSKGSADQYMLDYARMYGLNTAVFRHSSMYGGRQFATYDQGWIGWFCEQVLAQAKSDEAPAFTVSGNGKQVRDVLHADDMVELYLDAAERIALVRGNAFNIGGGIANSLSIRELLAFLGTELGLTPRTRQLPARTSDQLVFVSDIRKVQSLLGWKPRVQWQEGLRRMIDWVKSNA